MSNQATTNQAADGQAESGQATADGSAAGQPLAKVEAAPAPKGSEAIDEGPQELFDLRIMIRIAVLMTLALMMALGGFALFAVSRVMTGAGG